MKHHEILTFIKHPFFSFERLRNRFLYYLIIITNKRLKTEGRIVFQGKPIIDIADGASITIKRDVTLNSTNKGYHINLHSPVKLFADRCGAEIIIGENTRIHGTCIHAYNKISIGKNCLIAANTQIFDGSGHDISFPDVENRIYTKGNAKPIIIEDHVWIGANCIILPGVTIGNGSIIAAGSVVYNDIPPMVVAGGNPAKVIRDYSNKYLEKKKS